MSTHCDSNDLRMDNERERQRIMREGKRMDDERKKSGETEKNSVVLRDEDRKTKKWTE